MSAARTPPRPRRPARKQQQPEGWPAHPPTVRPGRTERAPSRPGPAQSPNGALRALLSFLTVPCGTANPSNVTAAGRRGYRPRPWDPEVRDDIAQPHTVTGPPGLKALYRGPCTISQQHASQWIGRPPGQALTFGSSCLAAALIRGLGRGECGERKATSIEYPPSA
jgi:hypothetical protein